MDDEVKILAYCEECGNAITSDNNEYFYDDDGNFFCSCECAMEYGGIHRLEV